MWDVYPRLRVKIFRPKCTNKFKQLHFFLSVQYYVIFYFTCFWTCDTWGVTKPDTRKTVKICSSCDAATQTQHTSSESGSDDFYSIEQDLEEEEEEEEVKTNSYPAYGIVVLSECFQIVTQIYHNCNSFARLVKDS